MLINKLASKESFQTDLSIDWVIFTFHDNQRKILLIKTKYSDKGNLPKGFVPLVEGIDEAAVTVLHVRTGLKGSFLRQFSTFGASTLRHIDFSNRILDF